MRTINIILGLALVVFLCYKAETIKGENNDYYENGYFTEFSENQESWTMISDDTVATVYNAVPAQCNNDVLHTASMYTLNLEDVLKDKVIAMERTMMAEYGIKYGDIVKIEGAGRWDGVWQVQDTMNKRFAGQHKIDILVPNDIRHGKWDNVKIYIPADDTTRAIAQNQINI